MQRLVLTALAIFILSQPQIIAAEKSTQSRPNILWISCEDISPNLGCYGDKNAHTPTLDHLAKQGVRYTSVFSTAGVCAPTRSGIITGMYPTTLGSNHMRSRITLPDHVKCFPEYLRKAGYYCTNNVKTDYNFDVPKTAWDECSRKAHWKNRPAGKPFFAVFNITVCHESQIRSTDERHTKNTRRLTPEQRQDPDKLTPPPYHPDTPVVRHDWARYYEIITAMDYQVADRLKELRRAGLEKDTIVFFWSDHGAGLPRMKRWLYDSGTLVPMIVRIPKKFRTDGQGKPNTVDDQLISFIDLAPTVLNLAGVSTAKHMQGRAFLGKNLSPPREYVFGARDRMDERYDIIRSVRDRRYRYIRNYDPSKTYAQELEYMDQMPTMKELRRLHAAGKLTDAAELFFRKTKPLEELYDLDKDPHEINNLADSPQYEKILNRMRGALRKWQDETKDLALMPEPELNFRAKKFGSQYAILRQPGAEDLIGRLRAVADAANTGNARKLMAAMDDPDAAVRCWAATGLGNLGSKAMDSLPRLEAALKDDSPTVR
ncbi:MAG: sulfatase-like hydrolase/transferase, partial [Pirellulales bacterium]|nr:sulfatase-like hydrolase/transferase [Pirellulales bacterium]